MNLRRSFVAELSLAMAALSAGCRAEPESAKEEVASAQATEPPTPQSQPIATVASIGRADLLAAAAAAADEVAAGGPLPAANLELTNRTFELRLPFGCSPGANAKWGEWTFDPKTKVLRVSVRPEVLTQDSTIRALADGLTYDAAEGFWIARPWTRSEQCPMSVLPEVAPTSTGETLAQTRNSQEAPTPTLAILQYFSPDDPRTMRRGSRPYAYTGRLPDTETIGVKGLRLKLKGRISGYGDGQPIRCIASAPYRPPVCAVAVEFAQVGLEVAASGVTLAEWGN